MAAFLFLNRSEHLLYGTNFEASTSPVYSALVSGVTHFNFFDFAIMSPLYKRLGLLGELDGYTSLATTSAITRAFFDAHLTDKGPVEWPRDPPHVEFASANVRDITGTTLTPAAGRPLPDRRGGSGVQHLQIRFRAKCL